MEISASATNGSRCSNERHRFRIGTDSTNATEFTAIREEMPGRLNDALITHEVEKRPGRAVTGLYLQVWTTASGKWRNVQNPNSGNVVGVTHLISGQPEAAHTLFDWACNSVQMGRDIDVIADGLAREAE